MTEYWEKTIQVFNNYIDYPQLTEKYLRRPPFKYIFQIFLTLNTKTGFAKDVFKEEELNPDFYDSPEKKMVFLKQILKIVYDLNSKTCPLKPQSIIKGTECDKTNEFLQDMYTAAVSFENSKKTSTQQDQGQKQNDKENEASRMKKQPMKTKETTNAEGEKPTHQPQNEKQEKSSKKATENPVKSVKIKENQKEKKQIENQTNLTNIVAENALKDEKILSSGTKTTNQIDQGIKMGKLSTGAVHTSEKSDTALFENEIREINYDEIKSFLQKITQNTNPLGKLIEFVDDDLDAMNKECKKWLRNFTETEEKLQKIEDEHNDEIQNCNFNINEINDQIFDMENKISSIRSRIQKNNTRIDTMLSKMVG